LQAHSQREDEAFFTVVEAAFGGEFGPTTMMRAEHDAIDEAILRLQTMLADAEPQWGVNDLGDWCGRLIHLIDAHFGKEEHVVFPMARQALTEDALRQIGAALDALRLR
jgi:hemerythrin-like domain-containing protein